MTTPAPPVTTASFAAVMWPPDISQIINLLLGGAPFAGSLTRFPTARSAVGFPTAAPDRPAWTAEGTELPVIGLHDDADLVAVCKLGEVVLLSNESVNDTSVNLTQQVGNLLADAAGPELDRGLLYGAGAPEPLGVVATAPAADGEDLAAALTLGLGQIGDSGGAASHLAAKPSVLAAARNLRDNEGRQLYPLGIGAAFGLAEIGAPELNDTLLYDATRCYLIVRNDFTVETSKDAAFTLDSLAVRVRGRFAVGIPALNKSVRRLTVTTLPLTRGGGAQAGSAQAGSAQAGARDAKH